MESIAYPQFRRRELQFGAVEFPRKCRHSRRFCRQFSGDIVQRQQRRFHLHWQRNVRISHPGHGNIPTWPAGGKHCSSNLDVRDALRRYFLASIAVALWNGRQNSRARQLCTAWQCCGLPMCTRTMCGATPLRFPRRPRRRNTCRRTRTRGTGPKTPRKRNLRRTA